MKDTVNTLWVSADEYAWAGLRNFSADLEGMREAVGGGYIEGIGGDGWTGYCDEEGKINGLPLNIRATRLAWFLGWPEDDVLCGPVVFLGPVDDEGEETDVTSIVKDAAHQLGYLDWSRSN